MVIGGGIIGLSAARELARQGWAVTVLEKGEPGQEATHAAAGMLAPRLEYAPGSSLLEAGIESQALYPSFARELEEETGIRVDLRWNGLVAPLAEGEEPPHATNEARRIRGREIQAIEPALSDQVRDALYFAEEGSVDNRAVVRALLAACRARGVKILAETTAESVLLDGNHVRGVSTRDAALDADVVINCAGAWAGQIRVPGAPLRTRPIKGQMLCLDASKLKGDAPARTLPARTIYSHDAYIVPRTDGRIIVGTTVEDRGFDKTIEPWAIAKLLDSAVKLCPALAALPLAETWAGLRPLGDDTAPRIEQVGPEGYFIAIGHYRNGILLAPLTARLLADRVSGREAKCAI